MRSRSLAHLADYTRYIITLVIISRSLYPAATMQSNPLLLAFLAKVVVCQSDSTWTAPTATDLRSPCPLLNSLANHGYLPHNGANISVSALLDGLDDALNLSEGARLFFSLQGNKALKASSTGNASTFHLTDLNTHDLIEHDGSLSRADIGQDSGDNWSFNATLFEETKTYWTSDTISLTQAASALYARQKTQQSANSKYDLPLAQLTNALGQTAMYLGLFGDYSDGNARKDWVVYFFGKRLSHQTYLCLAATALVLLCCTFTNRTSSISDRK